MPGMPETSTTLLRDVSNPESRRWADFVARYRPPMEAYLAAKFPSVDAEDVIQETFAAVAGALPGYVYSPDAKGHFRNYLSGILRHKAIRELERVRWRGEMKRKLRSHAASDLAQTREYVPQSLEEESAWRRSLMETALSQLLADGSIHWRTREVFRRVAVNGEKPEDVGVSLGISRNAVDQMKSRMTAKLKSLVRALEAAGA